MAGKLIITRGLPASGKSTWAAQYAEEAAQMDEAVRIVTMDDIRTAIGAIFDAGDEPVVQSVRDYTIGQYLRMGYTVISADTNLNKKTFERIERIGLSARADEIVVQDFTDVPLETCIARNMKRQEQGDFKVPHFVIEEMHERYIKKS
jgi:predicted kinase